MPFLNRQKRAGIRISFVCFCTQQIIRKNKLGDSIDITCQNSLFGIEYYYCDNIEDKDFYYDFWLFLGIIVDDDD